MSDLKSPSNGGQVAQRRPGRGALVRLTMALGVLSLSGCCIFGPVGGVCVPWGGPGGGGHARQGGEGGR